MAVAVAVVDPSLPTAGPEAVVDSAPLLVPLVSPPSEVPPDPEVVGLASAVAEGLPLRDGEVAALAEYAGLITGLEDVLTQFVPDVSTIELMRALVEMMGLALWLAVAVAVVTGVPFVLTLELGLTVPVGLVSDGVGVVGVGVTGVTLAGAVGCTVLLGETAGLAVAGLLGGQTVALGLADVAGVLPSPSAPAVAPLGTPLVEPVGLVAPVLLLCCCEESPTELPSETKAARSGGRDSATPIANTAQATATIGRIMRSRRSAVDRPGPLLLPPLLLPPCRPGPEAPGVPAGAPPGRELRRLIQPASPGAGASALSVVKAVPPRTRARIRSRPSGRGST